jgi:hypothetical protein
MAHSPDRYSQPWICPPEAEIGVGWLFDGVPFLNLDDDFDLRLAPGLGPDSVFAPVRFNYGLVVRCFSWYAALVPVVTSGEAGGNQQGFQQLVDSGRSSYQYILLPQLDSHWSGVAVALLFRPQALRTDFLRRPPTEAVASMPASAVADLDARVRRAVATP